MTRTSARLPGPLLQVLRDGLPALLLTEGSDGYPASAFTWVVALDDERVRFVADLGSATLANLEREGRASLQVLAPPDLVFLIKGRCAQVKARLASAAFPAAGMELRVAEAKDQSWPGVSVRPLAYEWAADARAKMLEMEKAVYSELRGD
jgi:hypothetical protein